MSKKRKTFFDESLDANMMAYGQYLVSLTQLAISFFKWENLPDTADSRYMELMLFRQGSVIFFEDEEMGFLTLSNIFNGNFDTYGNPIERKAFSNYNGYQRSLNKKNSVIIWNDMLHFPSYPVILNFARRLWNLDRIIDVNANAQKTPVLITCDERQKLTMLNLYKDYDGNSPVIFGNKSIDMNDISSIKTDAPFVAKDIYELKANIWNEALTFLGIPNANVTKKERLIKDEVLRGLGGTLANRYSRLHEREIACERINKMFNLDIHVSVREEIEDLSLLRGEPNE